MSNALELPAALDRRSSVYFAQNGRNGDIKIGWTTDLRQRLSALRSGAGADFHFIRTIDGGRPKEKWLHKRFAPQRIKGEWFKFHPDMLSVVPPDEIIRPKRCVVRRDIRLTVLERLREAEKSGREVGLSDRLILASFVSDLTDEEARKLLDLAAREGRAL